MKSMPTTGLGSGVVLAWAWGAFLVPNGWPELPPEIAAAIAPVIYQWATSISNM